ncbi:hypothetical protein OKW22_000503 [Bacilli bacterium PM5-3]|nr:hypothetical protein [Bacilli bacterium PM5-3]MDH6604152.1 hypothetical protein [Bacilli bacterium PM5-9]
MQEFQDEIIKLIEEEKHINQNTYNESLFDYYTKALEENDELIGECSYLHYEANLNSNQKCKIDGYSYNEIDGELILFATYSATNYGNNTLDKGQADKIFKNIKNFFVHADIIVENGEESSEGYNLAHLILNRKKSENEYLYSLEKIRMIILTEKEIVKSLQKIEVTEYGGLVIQKQIFDINSIKNLINSKSGKVDLTIKIDDEFGEIRAMKANETNEYESYLCIVSGLLLAKLYNKYGSKLIEGNVRSFLQTKGKVNKGLRATILNEPEKFFAYNNGLTVTCKNFTISEGKITSFTNLQIVNGGQTTASLANCLISDKAEVQLGKVYVPMKLNVVSSDDISDELIPEISRYANTQNKVSDVDLASNHPFHRRIEDFSRRITAPTKIGYSFATKWYYERANGQYAQETYKMTKSKKEKFYDINPKNQMFKKADFAKYFNIMSLKPHIASKGGVSAFREFTTWILKTWEKNDNKINEKFFKDNIANIILFKEIDIIVKNADWYNGYKANINAYTLSYLYWYCNEKLNSEINLSKIWLDQGIDNELKFNLKKLTKKIYFHLIDENRVVENVTEWAKKEMCWNKCKEKNLIDWDFNIDNILVSKEELKYEKKNAVKEQKIENQLNELATVYNYLEEDEKFYMDLYDFISDKNEYSDKEKDIIMIVAKSKAILSDKQAKTALQVIDKARLDAWNK